jgi:DDE superfamily endonuclease
MGRGNSVQTPKKALIRGRIQDGKSLRAIGREFKCSLSTVQRARDSTSDRRQYASHSGRRSIISTATIESIRRYTQMAPYIYRQNWVQLKAQFQLNCSTRTLMRACHKARIRLYICRPTQYRKNEITMNQFKWAADHYNDSEAQWRSRLSIDECIFEHGDIQKSRCIRESGTQDDSINRQKMDKRRKGWRLPVWGAVGYNYKSPLIIVRGSGKRGALKLVDYHRLVLEPHFDGILANFGGVAPLPVETIEDGNSSHGFASFGNICAQWRRDHKVKVMFHPSNSPDMQIVEDCWRWVKHRLRQYAITSEAQFEQLSLKLWDDMPQSYINGLFDCYPDRVHSLFDANGGDTRF